MRTTVFALLGIMMIAVLPAAADDDEDDGLSDIKFPPTIRCVTYKTEFEQNLKELGGLIPEPVYRPQKEFPGDLLLSNYDFVKAIIGCDEAGMFTGVGATIIGGEPKYERLWKPFVIALIQAMDKKYSSNDARHMFNELEEGALANARKNKSEPKGLYMGDKSIEIGNYWVYYTDGDRPKGFQIDLRYIPK